MNNRKIYLEALLREAVRIIKEQAPPLPVGSAVPPSPLPPAPATNASATASQPTAQAPADPNAAPEQKPFDVDEMIEGINLLRSGKTFKDPEVYGQVTSYFKGLSEIDKAVINRFLQSLGQIVTQGNQTQQQQTTNGGAPQPPMQQGPAPVAPAPAPSGPPTGGM